jgi:CRISPR-associated endonuclease/helicase Cas3
MIQPKDRTIMPESIAVFFHSITGYEILPYQQRYADNPFTSTQINIPTGLGKTLAVIVPWLYAVRHRQTDTPTRLVIILPRQNLTEQTRDIARDLVVKTNLTNVRVLQLMGGSDDNDLTLQPDQKTIIVCTQDLYLSRALNRGYARRAPRWPIDFALFNNDCLLVFDEVQIMSDGLATSSQLAAFRENFGVFGNVPCVWMSATLNPEWLETIDFRDRVGNLPVVRLEDSDHTFEIVRKRVYAPKTIAPAPQSCCDPRSCATFVLEQHQSDQGTLVIANTVQRAKEIFQHLRHHPGAILLHSRFRPADRRAKVAQLLKPILPEGQIVVSTQVLEAGIDFSAHRLITDIAPWSSLVQRFGRVNRKGDYSASSIWWVNPPLSSKSKPKEPDTLYLPYSVPEIELSLRRLSSLTSAAPADLQSEDGPAPWNFVLRNADLLDLFDTSPDISGNDLDISRFIRAGDEKDAYVAWRNWDEGADTSNLPEAADEELCPVSLGDLREFLRKQIVYTWNFSSGHWDLINVRDRERLYPGMIVLANANAGGYTEELGWEPASKRPVTILSQSTSPAEADADDPRSNTRRQSLFDHTTRVYQEVARLLRSLGHLDLSAVGADVLLAATKHDWGKAHPVMQRTLHNATEWTELLAKQDKGKAAGRHERKHFRHELASALAMLASGDSDLAAYLVAAHHGRIRISIRSMAGETNDRMRGIENGDELPACRIFGNTDLPAITLSLNIARLGSDAVHGPSWTDRAITLRDSLGPFRLAYLETLLRSADEYASEFPNLEQPCPE